MELAINIFISVSGAVLALFCSYKMLQIFQLSSYKMRAVIAWLRASAYDYLIRYFSLFFLSFIGMFIFVACFQGYFYIKYIGVLFYLGLAVLFALVTKNEHKKTPLKFTPRIVRTSCLFVVLSGAISYLLIFLGSLFEAGYSLVALNYLLIPFITALSFIVLKPVEWMICRKFKAKAIKKLDKMPNLIKIGITGSYGKTSAKNILASMLSKKYKVAFSPSSYNTPMGLSRFINNDLREDAQILIAEMGARQAGDIKELTLMINPSIALITSIGNQHLETFHTIENVANTKNELVEYMQKDGTAIFNDGDYVTKLWQECKKAKLITGQGVEGKELDAFYSDVECNGKTTSFNLNLSGEETKITTPLLGKHIAGLITACAKISSLLNVTLDEIRQACQELEPVPHRLQLIENGDTLILDDAYNANLDGARNALEVLNKLEGVKVIITPGLVELGSDETEANMKLGEEIANAKLDYAYLIGVRAVAIKKGALRAEMDEGKIFVFTSLNEAVEKLKEIEGKKAVLFENDLPDNY